jgi:hypothetical protein
MRPHLAHALEGREERWDRRIGGPKVPADPLLKHRDRTLFFTSTIP